MNKSGTEVRHQTTLTAGSVGGLHVLPDGRIIGRDQAAAWVLWNIGQRILGEEQARTYSSETEARAA
jgi:hypothetical protein